MRSILTKAELLEALINSPQGMDEPVWIDSYPMMQVVGVGTYKDRLCIQAHDKPPTPSDDRNGMPDF